MLDGMANSPGSDHLVSGIPATVNTADAVQFASEAGSGRETRARPSILDLCRKCDKFMVTGRCLRGCMLTSSGCNAMSQVLYLTA